MKVYEELGAALRKHDVGTLFGLMGDANMLYVSQYIAHGGRFVRATHEGAAVAMADAYHRVTGRLGLVSVTHGPAFTNTMTTLVEAVRSRSALVLLTGDTPREPTHFQRANIRAFAEAAGAGYERVYRETSVVRDLNRAIQRAVADRRPVVLDVPATFLRAEGGGVEVQGAVTPATSIPSAASVEDAVAALMNARRPLFLLGRGAGADAARAAVLGLADMVGAAVGTTLLGKGSTAGHPRDCGIVGSLMSPPTSGVVAAADVVVAFGASLNSDTTLRGELLAGKITVQCDREPAAFGGYHQPDVAVCGDVEAVADAVTTLLKETGQDTSTGWAARVEDMIAGGVTVTADPPGVDVASACRVLNRVLPQERTLVCDLGRFALAAWTLLDVPDPGRFVAMSAFGSIGLGLGGAVGAAVGSGDLTVLAVGDGGFMMSATELSTAVHERLKLVVLVFDDGAYGAEYLKLERYGVDPNLAVNAWPDLGAVARGLGAHTVTVRTPADYELVAQAVTNEQFPLVVDVRLDPRDNPVQV